MGGTFKSMQNIEEQSEQFPAALGEYLKLKIDSLFIYAA